MRWHGGHASSSNSSSRDCRHEVISPTRERGSLVASLARRAKKQRALMEPSQPVRVLVLGAHPDDADIKVGGTAAKWCALGHVVKLVSLTDGGAGHQTLRRPELVEWRRAEARAAGAVLGASYDVLDFPDGELL